MICESSGDGQGLLEPHFSIVNLSSNSVFREKPTDAPLASRHFGFHRKPSFSRLTVVQSLIIEYY